MQRALSGLATRPLCLTLSAPSHVSSFVLRRAFLRHGTQQSEASLPPRRNAGSLSQKPDSSFVSFPGAIKSVFTNKLQFEIPSEYPAMPTYRVIDQHGAAIDSSFEPDLDDDKVVRLYRDMLTMSIMDIIMFDAQRQGRISFYMVSSGEEAAGVGSASALAPEDVIFCQYREQGVFQQRGFTMKEFMGQLFSNRNDAGKGRNMPVHYGSGRLNIVRYQSLPLGPTAVWAAH